MMKNMCSSAVVSMYKVPHAFCAFSGAPPLLEGYNTGCRRDTGWWLPNAYAARFENEPPQGDFCLRDPLAYVTHVFNDLFYFANVSDSILNSPSLYEEDQRFVSTEMICALLYCNERVRKSGVLNMMTDLDLVVRLVSNGAVALGVKKGFRWRPGLETVAAQDLQLVRFQFALLGRAQASDMLRRLDAQGCAWTTANTTAGDREDADSAMSMALATRDAKLWPKGLGEPRDNQENPDEVEELLRLYKRDPLAQCCATGFARACERKFGSRVAAALPARDKLCVYFNTFSDAAERDNVERWLSARHPPPMSDDVAM